jgi:hypothetical protein
VPSTVASSTTDTRLAELSCTSPRLAAVNSKMRGEVPQRPEHAETIPTHSRHVSRELTATLTRCIYACARFLSCSIERLDLYFDLHSLLASTLDLHSLSDVVIRLAELGTTTKHFVVGWAEDEEASAASGDRMKAVGTRKARVQVKGGGKEARPDG